MLLTQNNFENTNINNPFLASSIEEQLKKDEYNLKRTIVSKSEVLDPSLDTNMKFVRTPQQITRINMEKMRSFSGTILIDQKDEERGYNTTCICGKKRISEKMQLTVPVVQEKQDDKLYFSGLVKCGSVWRCPICSYKISSFRQKEIYKMACAWQGISKYAKLEGQGKRISFITLTIKHNFLDKLKTNVDLLLSEFLKFQRTKVYKRLEKEHNIEGFVKTLEITYGVTNGWHPHLHLMVFHDTSDYETLHQEFLDNWCKRKKVGASIKAQKAEIICKDRNDWEQVTKRLSEYLAKWDMAKEMTKSNYKLAGNPTDEDRRYTPFSMLKALTFGEFDHDVHKRVFFYMRFREYLQATKGKHYISVSKRMKAFFKDVFSEDIKSEKEILEQELDYQVEFNLDYRLFDSWVDYKETGYILNAYENSGIAGVLDLFRLCGYNVGYDEERKIVYDVGTYKMDYDNQCRNLIF